MQDFLTPLLVVAVALVDRSGRILLQRRRPEAVHGGLWEFPGGKMEPGESAQTAALREIAEDLGLTLEESALKPLTFASGFTPPSAGGRPLVILLYTCRAWRGEAECRDADEIGWFEPDGISGLAMPELDYPLAEALLCAMGKNSL